MLSIVPTHLWDEACRLFPAASDDVRRRWCSAKIYAANCRPAYAKLLPLTEASIPARDDVFFARTLREAGL